MAFDRLSHYFNETIWSVDIDTLPLVKRFFFRVARVTHIVVKGFSDEHLNQQAAALTYVSFLSIIPLLAVLFSVAKGFGFQEKVKPWVKDALPLVDEQILDKIIEYVSNTNLAALGAIGLLVLIWTVLKTLLYLEKSFNRIWSVENSRPLYRALAYYLSVVIIVPLMVGASTTLMTVLQAGDPETGPLNWLHKIPGVSFVFGFLDQALPFGITCVAFFLMYTFMVNTRVRFLPTVGGAFAASLLWNLLQWIYIETQLGLSKNAIYGTFASIPIFLVYLYLSWLTLLFGSRIAFALQNETAFRRDWIARAAGTRYRAASGLLILQEIARSFHAAKGVKKPADIAAKLDLPLPLVDELLGLLLHADIVHRVVNDPSNGSASSVPVPARALDKIMLSEVVDALEGGEGTVRMPAGAMQGRLREVLDKAEQARLQAIEGISLEDLLQEPSVNKTTGDPVPPEPPVD